MSKETTTTTKISTLAMLSCGNQTHITFKLDSSFTHGLVLDLSKGILNVNKIGRTMSKRPQKNVNIVTSLQPVINKSIESERENKTQFYDFNISTTNSSFNSPINQDTNKKCNKASQPKKIATPNT